MAFIPQQVTVTYGEEMFSVPGPGGRWCHFKVGPFMFQTTQLLGETIDATWKRAFKEVNQIADKVFIAKRNRFFEHLESLQETK